MVDIKEKKPIQDEKFQKDVAKMRKMLRFCIRCTVEMTHQDQEAIIHEKKAYGEWNEFMVPEERQVPDAFDYSDECSEEASNDFKEEMNSAKDVKDPLIRKVLDEYYRTSEKTSRGDFFRQPFGTQQRHQGDWPAWHLQPRPRLEPKFEGMIEGDKISWSEISE